MIETIFYFANSAAEYNQNKSELSARTISFVPNGDGTGKIYKNGVQYGGSDYELPAASSSVLGGIKTGYTTSGKNYAVQLDGNNRAFVNVPWEASQGGGTSGGQDWSDEIAEINNIINGEKTRLDNLLSDLNNKIQIKVNNMFDDSEWLQEHVAGKVAAESNFGEDDVESYLQRIGVWSRNNDITKAQWSQIRQDVDTLSLAVNALSSDGNITEALQASIDAAVRNGVASLDLGTTYAKVEDQNDIKKVIEWLYSGLSSQTSSTTTFNNLTSAANSGNSSAISDLRTYVNKLKSGEYVAEADLSTKVDEKMAGFVSKSGVDTAVAQLFASDVNTGAKAAVSAMIQDGISEVVVNADKIALIADAVDVDSDMTISGNILAKRVVDSHDGIIIDAAGVIIPLHDVVFNQSGSGLYWKSRPALGRGSGSSSSDENTPTFSGVEHYIKATPDGWDIYPAIGGTTNGITGTIHALGADFTVTNGVITAVTQVNNLTLSLT